MQRKEIRKRIDDSILIKLIYVRNGAPFYKKAYYEHCESILYYADIVKIVYIDEYGLTNISIIPKYRIAYICNDDGKLIYVL